MVSFNGKAPESYAAVNPPLQSGAASAATRGDAKKAPYKALTEYAAQLGQGAYTAAAGAASAASGVILRASAALKETPKVEDADAPFCVVTLGDCGDGKTTITVEDEKKTILTIESEKVATVLAFKNAPSKAASLKEFGERIAALDRFCFQHFDAAFLNEVFKWQPNPPDAFSHLEKIELGEQAYYLGHEQNRNIVLPQARTALETFFAYETALPNVAIIFNLPFPLAEKLFNNSKLGVQLVLGKTRVICKKEPGNLFKISRTITIKLSWKEDGKDKHCSYIVRQEIQTPLNDLLLGSFTAKTKITDTVTKQK